MKLIRSYNKKKQRIFILSAVLPLFMLSACSAGEQAVSYTRGANYFVNIDYTETGLKKFLTREEFCRCFGEAAVMGRNGQPTSIDFTKSFVVARILAPTDLSTEITPAGITRGSDGTLTVRSIIKSGGKRSYTVRPFYMLILPRKYADAPLRSEDK